MDTQTGPARLISLGGDAFPLMQAHMVAEAQRLTGPQKHSRLVCEWGPHPTTLLLAAGLLSPRQPIFTLIIYLWREFRHPMTHRADQAMTVVLVWRFCHATTL